MNKLILAAVMGLALTACGEPEVEQAPAAAAKPEASGLTPEKIRDSKPLDLKPVAAPEKKDVQDQPKAGEAIPSK